MAKKKKVKDPETQKFVFGRPVNKAAKEARTEEGVGTQGVDHAGDPHYYFKRGKWVLKPQYEQGKK